ncbi:MAG TPA: hypothetical protein ENN99_03935 [Chloroflexi bacterium]|nr:hypothetical protein [Chloroflexota bacterium]
MEDGLERDDIELGDSTAEPTPTPTGARKGRLRRLWARVGLAWAWLRRPDEVGRPVTLRPQGVRLLVLLVLGNLVVLILLTIGLFQTASAPTVVERRVMVPIAATTSPHHSPIPTPGPTPTPFGSGGAIAFTLRRNGNADVYALNQTDRQLVRLTKDGAEDRDPAWSPDGNYIAFASNRANNWDIYLLDLLSGALIRLTHDPAFDANPTWSPDGQWIAFESYREGNLDIFVMSTTGQQLRRITSDPAPNYEPAWSPDSRAIAYTTFSEGNKDIYVQMIDQVETVINVTQSPDLDEYEPAWSPDGSQLAYVSGPRSNPSIQVTAFDWDTMVADQAQTEVFGAGLAPAWAPDGQSFIYAYRRGEQSHIVAASIAGWALFHDVYSIDGFIDDLAWTSASLSPRTIARAQADVPAHDPPFYVELVQPTPRSGPPYDLVLLQGVEVVSVGGGQDVLVATMDVTTSATTSVTSGVTVSVPATATPVQAEVGEEDSRAYLSDRVNESFNALRRRVVQEAGWDYLARLSVAQLPMNYTPYAGQSRMTWYVCGRAFGLDRAPYEEENPPRVELVREEIGTVTYWRVFVRAAQQDGSMGEPLREGVWDMQARRRDAAAMVEGGKLKESIPSGYYVDFTTLAGDYGWERVPSLWRWRYFWPDVLWWRFQKTTGLSWWDCMLEVFEPDEIEAAFGPIPGYED